MDKTSKNVNKLDYLKKYLSGADNNDTKKKKKRPKVKGTGMKIIDDDVDLSKLRHLDDTELEILGGGEDAPIVVGIIDERPEHVKVAEHYSKDKWKVITQDDGFNSSITVTNTGSRNTKSHKMSKNSSDSDLSPVRSKNVDGKTNSSETKRKNSKLDLSPVRNEKSNKHKGQDSDSDMSPIRHSKKADHRRKKHDSDSDMSPVRHSKKADHRRKKHDSDSDMSPVRHSKKADHRSKKQDSDSDMSPPRRRKTDQSNSVKHHLKSKKHESYSKLQNERMNDRSKAKKSRWDTDDSPSNGNGANSRKYDQNKSYERKMEGETSGESRLIDREVGHERMERTLDGKKAGLQDAKHLREETQEFRKKEDELFGKLSEDLTGRHAKAIKRNLGKRETSEDREKQREKEEKQKELQAKYDRWGKGIKQVEEHEARIKDYMHEAAKPMARYKDDRDLEDNLRRKERDGDPMLEYMRRKEKEKGETSGAPAYPVYKGPYPPNRFNLRPGHRWDGVDRSNGHEKNYFSANSKRVAMEAEKYKWSTEDM